MAVRASAKYSPYPIENFAGGMAVDPQADMESELFQNWEILPEGQCMSRLGTSRLNTLGCMTTTEPRGMGIGVVGAGAGTHYLAVAKGGATWHAIAYDPTEYAQWRPLAQEGGGLFGWMATPYDPGSAPVQIETMSVGQPAVFSYSSGAVTPAGTTAGGAPIASTYSGPGGGGGTEPGLGDGNHPPWGPHVPLYLEVIPGFSFIPWGGTLQLRVILHQSVGNTVDVTDQCTYSITTSLYGYTVSSGGLVTAPGVNPDARYLNPVFVKATYTVLNLSASSRLYPSTYVAGTNPVSPWSGDGATYQLGTLTFSPLKILGETRAYHVGVVVYSGSAYPPVPVSGAFTELTSGGAYTLTGSGPDYVVTTTTSCNNVTWTVDQYTGDCPISVYEGKIEARTSGVCVLHCTMVVSYISVAVYSDHTTTVTATYTTGYNSTVTVSIVS